MKKLLPLILLLSTPFLVHAQDNEWWKMEADKKKPNVVRRESNGPTPGEAAISSHPVATNTTSEVTGTTHPLTKLDTLIPANSTVYVDEMPDGFQHYLMAAMRKKSVPLIVIADPSQADFIILGVSETKRAGWAKMLFLGSGQSGEMASITMVNRKTKVVVFSDSSHRYNALRGRRSTAEKLAKYLRNKIKDDQAKLKHNKE